MTTLLLLACSVEPKPDGRGDVVDTSAETDTDPASDSGSETGADSGGDTAADTGGDTAAETGAPPYSPEAVARLSGGPEELSRLFVSDTLFEGGPAVVVGTSVGYPDIPREAGDVVVGGAVTSVYRYPAHGEELSAPDVEGDGTMEPLYAGDVDEDGVDDLLVGTWAGVVTTDEYGNSVVGDPSLSLIRGPLAAGAPLPAPAWTVTLSGGYSLEAARGPAPDGVGDATWVEERYGIYRVDAATGAAEEIVPRATWAKALVARDLDGDGLGDLARLDGSALIVTLGPVTDGAWADHGYWYVNGYQPRDVVAADLDQDGLAELALATSEEIWLLPLSSGGAVEETGAPHLDVPGLNTTRLAAGDADQDGGEDLLVGDRYAGDGHTAWLVLGPVSASMEADVDAVRLPAEASLGDAVAFGPAGDLLVASYFGGEVWVFGSP